MPNKYIFLPNFENGQGKVPFICSLSPLLRAAVEATGTKTKLGEQIKILVEEIDADEEVAKSLKQPPLIPGTSETRQVDLRRDNNGSPGEIVFKCYVSWDHDKKWWLVRVEGADEQYWEKILRAVNHD